VIITHNRQFSKPAIEFGGRRYSEGNLFHFTTSVRFVLDLFLVFLASQVEAASVSQGGPLS
jgi:hypothetical protein